MIVIDIFLTLMGQFEKERKGHMDHKFPDARR